MGFEGFSVEIGRNRVESRKSKGLSAVLNGFRAESHRRIRDAEQARPCHVKSIVDA